MEETKFLNFFKKISHQKEFDHLIINENYGLEIGKSDGSIVPNRSSGYEQVVAISLISALHKNAPHIFRLHHIQCLQCRFFPDYTISL